MQPRTVAYHPAQERLVALRSALPPLTNARYLFHVVCVHGEQFEVVLVRRVYEQRLQVRLHLFPVPFFLGRNAPAQPGRNLKGGQANAIFDFVHAEKVGIPGPFFVIKAAGMKRIILAQQ